MSGVHTNDIHAGEEELADELLVASEVAD